MARSYIKIYGPPVLSSLKSLEKVAVEMSKKTTIRYYSALIPPMPSTSMQMSPRDYNDMMLNYTQGVLTDVELPGDEKIKLISKSGDTLGEYDFFFEWGREPTKKEVQELIGMIDETLADCGCRYTIVTK